MHLSSKYMVVDSIALDRTYLEQPHDSPRFPCSFRMLRALIYALDMNIGHWSGVMCIMMIMCELATVDYIHMHGVSRHALYRHRSYRGTDGGIL